MKRKFGIGLVALGGLIIVAALGWALFVYILYGVMLPPNSAIADLAEMFLAINLKVLSIFVSVGLLPLVPGLCLLLSSRTKKGKGALG